MFLPISLNKIYFTNLWLLQQTIPIVKFSNLANSSLKNAIYSFVLPKKGEICFPLLDLRKKGYVRIEGSVVLFNL